MIRALIEALKWYTCDPGSTGALAQPLFIFEDVMMTISESVVLSKDEKLNELMARACDECLARGGTYEVKSEYVTGTGWFNRYKLNWPSGMEKKPDARLQRAYEMEKIPGRPPETFFGGGKA